MNIGNFASLNRKERGKVKFPNMKQDSVVQNGICPPRKSVIKKYFAAKEVADPQCTSFTDPEGDHKF